MSTAPGLAAAFRPGTIGSLRLPHRIVMGSMHLNFEDRDDGGASVAAFYAERARGGAALIVTGGAAVSRVGAGGRHYGLVNEPPHQPALARWAEAVHGAGGLIALQLFHAGRYAFGSSFGLPPVAPSPVYSGFSRCTPEELTAVQIEQTLADFARGAAAARRLGFDGVEVMGSEGYLVNQFLSPVTNQRTDDWGGDAPRRRRFALELVRRIREEAGADFPLIFRMSGADLVEGSSDPAEVQALAAELARAGVDALNVGIGWHESPVPTVQTLVPAGAWVGYAESVKDAVRAAGFPDLPVIASNRINRVEMAAQVLARGGVDFVSMARPFLADPDIVAKTAAGRTALVNVCIACNEACIDRSLGESFVSCLVNPRAGRELAYPRPVDEHPADGRPAGGSERPSGGQRLRFAVVGAGPAGLEAARALATLGHEVELFEADAELGGQFRMARLVPGKADFGETIRYYANELDRLGVTVRLRHPVGSGDVEGLRAFAGAVLATGVLPRAVSLPGVELPHVLTYPQAFADPGAVGERVAIIGAGGIALDLAHLLAGDPTPSRAAFLAAYGLDPAGRPTATPPPARRITVMRRTGRVGEGVGRSTRWALVATVRRHGTQTLTGVSYQAIVPEGVRIVDESGAARLVEADTVVVAAGQEPNCALEPALRAAGIPYRVVGGAADARGLNAVRATEQALAAAYEMGTARAGEATPVRDRTAGPT